MVFKPWNNGRADTHLIEVFDEHADADLHLGGARLDVRARRELPDRKHLRLALVLPVTQHWNGETS